LSNPAESGFRDTYIYLDDCEAISDLGMATRRKSPRTTVQNSAQQAGTAVPAARKSSPYIKGAAVVIGGLALCGMLRTEKPKWNLGQPAPAPYGMKSQFARKAANPQDYECTGEWYKDNRGSTPVPQPWTPDVMRSQGFKDGYYYFDNFGQQPKDAVHCRTLTEFDNAGREAALRSGALRPYGWGTILAAGGVAMFTIGIYWSFYRKLRKALKS